MTTTVKQYREQLTVERRPLIQSDCLDVLQAADRFVNGWNEQGDCPERWPRVCHLFGQGVWLTAENLKEQTAEYREDPDEYAVFEVVSNYPIEEIEAALDPLVDDKTLVREIRHDVYVYALA